MTAQETKTVQQISIEQAVMKEIQKTMNNDLKEVKNDIKEILSKLEQHNTSINDRFSRQEGRFITKWFMLKLVTISMGLASIAVAIWHEIK